MNEKFRILIQILLKFVSKGTMNNKSALVQAMTMRQAFTWTNSDLIRWRKYAVLNGLNVMLIPERNWYRDE